MSFYSQHDGRWGSMLLGYNTEQPWNIYNYGCLVTAWGNMLWKITGDAGYTPAMVNQWLKDHGGFTAGGGTMIWSVPLGMGVVESKGTLADIYALNNWLADAPNYAIIEVRTKTGGQHFVTGIAIGQIIDAADGQIKAMGTYTFVNAHLYTIAAGRGSSSPQTAPAPDPAAVTNGDIQMSPDQEKNAYRIMLGRADENPSSAPRSGYQFILDGEAELNAQRANAAAQVASAMQQASDAEAAKAAAEAVAAQLQADADRLTAQLAAQEAAPPAAPAPEASAAPAAEPTPEPAPEPPTFTLPEIPYTTTHVAPVAGEMVDAEGIGGNLSFNAGTVFKSHSIFTDTLGQRWLRTQRGADQGTWYGVDPHIFPNFVMPVDPNLSKTDVVHAGAAKLAGIIGRFFVKLWPFGKKSA